MMNMDAIVDKLHIYSTRQLWRESNIVQFEQRNLTKQVLCGRTNALINTYFANPDDPNIQYIGEQLLETYNYADEYLVKLQLALMFSIDNNRAIINAEKQKVKNIVDRRAKNDQQSTNTRIAKREQAIINCINKLPEDIVNHIKSYLPPLIILSAISIPTYNLITILSPLKLKNVKIIYDRMRNKTLPIFNKLRGIATRDVIRDTDIDILTANQPSPSKQAIIVRIRDICYCYNLVLNILSRLKQTVTSGDSNRDRDTICYCNEANKILNDELTYIYKLMRFAAIPQNNGRAKPKPRPPKSKANTPTKSQ